MEKLAKIASGALNTSIDFIIPLPSEIFIILPGIFDQSLQVFGQILGRVEIERVYVRSWWGKETIIGATVHDWDHVVPEGIVQLLGYVIVAERILEREVEKIVGFDDLLEAVHARWTIHGPAFPVNVDRYVPRQLVHVLLPTAFCLTVAHEPDYRPHLPTKHLR